MSFHFKNIFREISKRIKPNKTVIYDTKFSEQTAAEFGPVIGVHLGPGALGAGICPEPDQGVTFGRGSGK